jgi:hypothetical protein
VRLGIFEKMRSELAKIGTSRVRMAHFFWKHTISPGDTAIDATCGHGKDSLELARLVTDTALKKYGRLVAFDIQKSAIDATRSRLLENNIDMNRVKLYHEGHENLIKRSLEDKEWFENVSLVSFNLGYLPGSDHSVQTRVTTTLQAVDGASKIIVPGGVISIVQYPHEEGVREAAAIRDWYKSLDRRDWMITNMMMPQEEEVQPSIVFVIKRWKGESKL